MPRSIPISVRSKATPSRCRSTSGFPSTSRRSGRSSWKAPGETAAPAEFGYQRDRVFNVVRGEYAFTPASYVGAIATDTEFAGTFNRVVGADLSWKVSEN